MLEINSREDLVRALRANEIVLIGYYDPDTREGMLFHDIYKELSKHADPRILVLRVNTRKNPEFMEELPTIPCIRVYYRGKVIFEQQGFFGKRDLDVYVLRRSIRSVFHGLNLAFKI